MNDAGSDRTGPSGTGATDEGDPTRKRHEATLWVNRSVDYPEAPAQASGSVRSLSAGVEVSR